MGRIGPLGTDVVNFPTGPAFATLKSTDQPWPEANQQVRFGGYFLDELQRPTFMYRLGSTEFEDFFLPRENGGQLSLLRTLTIKPQKDLSPTEPVWFRLYEGQDLVPVENGYRCDGKLLIQPSVDSEVGKLVTRETATGMELLIRISPTKNRSQFKVLYQW